MNICFRVTHVSCSQNLNIQLLTNKQHENIDESEKLFLKGADEKGLTGLKGHRSVGGIRASNYNSISLEGAEKLAAYIGAFAESPRE
jgi:phosphoserine aminotransferase